MMTTSRRYSTYTDQEVVCEYCGFEGTADVFRDRVANVAGFRCPDCERHSQA